MLIALLFTDQKSPVVVIALKLASILAGGIVGLYVLAFSRVDQLSAFVGFLTSAISMALIAVFTPLAWTWFVPAGFGICLTAVGLAMLVLKIVKREKNVAG